jgi:hypothetical protein
VILAVFIGSMVRFLFSGGSVGMIVEIMAIPFAIWICATVVIFIVARALSGSGSLFATFQNTGFGMFPWILEAAGTVGFFSSVNWSLGIFNSLLFPLL